MSTFLLSYYSTFHDSTLHCTFLGIPSPSPDTSSRYDTMSETHSWTFRNYHEAS